MLFFFITPPKRIVNQEVKKSRIVILYETYLPVLLKNLN
ncbi:hypothetical protein LEP1GSC158_5354 [Leptospira interrogans serovar Zanoni str. LT2156]|uniref:Uncharacterized protein n=1 Tax=Leptospira interrogans serovar Zanoni str. LT2156 TaxID=1001601 RepID=M6HHU0_LEPIR|nr:hypothetical protein LEP1GSC158_5354 [Leptospira interrogans serovar Zanoni str. LT2156]